jgi:hypothetical protein
LGEQLEILQQFVTISHTIVLNAKTGGNQKIFRFKINCIWMLFDICLQFVYTAFMPAEITSAKCEGDCRVIDKGLSHLILSHMPPRGGCQCRSPHLP